MRSWPRHLEHPVHEPAVHRRATSDEVSSVDKRTAVVKRFMHQRQDEDALKAVGEGAFGAVVGSRVRRTKCPADQRAREQREQDRRRWSEEEAD